MAIPDELLALRSHAAPGLHFAAHETAQQPPRTVSAPHRFGPRATEAELGQLRDLTMACPRTQSEFLELYGWANGADLCCLKSPFGIGSDPALNLLSVEGIRYYTDELIEGELAWLIHNNGLSEFFRKGTCVVFAVAPNEETRLVSLLAGTHEGASLARRVVCVSMDPIHGYLEPLFHGVMAGLADFAAEPAAFLRRIGFCYTAIAPDGCTYGWPPHSYVPDIGVTQPKRAWAPREDDRP